ncbi:MAG: SDR family NAD(P)-dependent oxidoreductase [Xanthobacteraceae bacterium]|nr:SDR family NAD(P)-dependent oxidoreductase [Xanthobacteraceae bacterium]
MALDGQLALVTGGAAGIGAAITRPLAEDGADVAVVDISSTADEAIEKLSVRPGQRVKSWHCDVSKPAEVSSTYDTIRRELGDPTILINNVDGSGHCKYVHNWSTGDLLIWGNLLLQHARLPFDSNEPHTLRRTPII